MVLMPTGFPTAEYFRLLTIWHNQQTQDTQNQIAHDAYVGAASNWQVQNESKLAHGQPLLPPLTPPQKVTYNDDSTQTLTNFADLAPTAMPTLREPTATDGKIANPNPPMDRTDALLLIEQQNNQLLTEVRDALKAKGVI